jgi:DNA polymerase-3 subunit gamma/tau
MIDVIEIDAASYTGVDDIREIIEHAKFTPTQGKYKVYIIDEVHMLSKNAFNALLKTLEEPPAHVIFLLATTEIHKVPDTVLSRVIRFDLTKLSEKDIYDLLVKICGQEKISYEENALHMLVNRARGSIRDSLTLLEKCIIDASVTEKNVTEALHLVNTGFLRETFDACISGDGAAIAHIISTIDDEAIDVRQFSTQMTEWIVDNISEAFQKNAFPAYREIFDLFTRIFVQSRQVSVPMDILRMALYERVRGMMPPPRVKETPVIAPEVNPAPEKVEEVQENIPEIQTVPEETETISEILPEELPEIQPAIQEEPPVSAEVWETPAEEWTKIDNSAFSSEEFLSRLEKAGIKSTIIPLLKTAHMHLDGNTLEIQTTGFCKSKCVEAPYYQILESVAQSFNADTINITVPNEVQPETSPTEESTEDIARSLFE